VKVSIGKRVQNPEKLLYEILQTRPLDLTNVAALPCET